MAFNFFKRKKPEVPEVVEPEKPDNRIDADLLLMHTDVFRMKCKLFMFRYQIPLVLVKYNRKTKKFVEVL